LLAYSVCLVRPRSRGTIRLTSANPVDPPLIDSQYLVHPLDREDMMEALKYSYFLLLNTSLAQYVNLIPVHVLLGCPKCADRPLYQCDAYVDCIMRMTTTSGLHTMGTCRMGAEGKADVVVTERLAVKGVSGLRVCDSSVFSDSVNANTNAPTIMVVEKCADLVIGDRRSGQT
jgi:choline dehydrogenase